jgi:uncharacterized protein YbjT (DUF2867 family)
MTYPVKNLLVLGGSGFLGRALCEQLSRIGQGIRITVPTRRPAHAKALWSLPAVQVVTEACLDDATLTRLCSGRDAVINLVGILNGSTAEFNAAHAELPERIARACAQAGVGRLLHVGALGASVQAPSAYLRSKAAGESALKAQPGIQATILRPSVVHGPDDRFLNLFAAMSFLPVLPLAGADAKLQPVWVQDVARALVQCLRLPQTAGVTYEIAGPKVYTLRELAQLAAQMSGHSPLVIGLPAALAYAQAMLMELVPGKPLLTRDNLLSLDVPSVASGLLPGLEELNIQAASVEDVAPWTVGPESRMRRFNAFRAQRD